MLHGYGYKYNIVSDMVQLFQISKIQYMFKWKKNYIEKHLRQDSILKGNTKEFKVWGLNKKVSAIQL